MRTWAPGVVVALALSATACYYDDYPYDDDAYYVYDSAYAYDYTYDYYWYGYDPLYGYYWYANAIESDAAERTAALAPEFFAPAGCVDATSDAGTATLILDGCQGPRSGYDVSGELSFTYRELEDQQLMLEIDSPGVTIGETDLVLSATSTASAEGDVIGVAATTSIQGSGPRLGRFELDAETTLQWQQGADCLQVDGAVAGNRDGQDTSLTFDRYRRCGASCPASGTVTIARDDRTVEVVFDGSARAAWRGLDEDGAEDDSGLLDLACDAGG